MRGGLVEVPRRPGAVTVAGWMSIAAAVLAGLFFLWFLWLAASDGVEEFAGGPDEWGLYAVLAGAALTVVVIAAVPVALSVLALRGSPLGRYLLIAAWILIGLFLQFSDVFFWDGLFDVPAPMLPAAIAVFAVPILLARGRRTVEWYAMKEWMRSPGGRESAAVRAECAVRGFSGARGLALLAVNLLVFGFYVWVAVIGANDALNGFIGVALGHVLTVYFVVALFLGIWALNGDASSTWAGINIAAVVAAPAVIAGLGFVLSAADAYRALLNAL